MGRRGGGSTWKLFSDRFHILSKIRSKFYWSVFNLENKTHSEAERSLMQGIGRAEEVDGKGGVSVWRPLVFW